MNRKIYQTCMVSLFVFGITACSDDHDNVSTEQQETFQTASKDDYEPLTGKKLTDVAGQVATPIDEEGLADHISDNALPYVGRYRVVVSCKDPIVFCEQGTADFILNLLPDGTAHRTVIHLGTITFASENQYRQDYWKYDELNHQIILKRVSGVEFFYDIDKDKNLTMNLDRIANATDVNRTFFQEGNPFPHEAYKLKPENIK